jgi:hypothetical protein
MLDDVENRLQEKLVEASRSIAMKKGLESLLLLEPPWGRTRVGEAGIPTSEQPSSADSASTSIERRIEKVRNSLEEIETTLERIGESRRQLESMRRDAQSFVEELRRIEAFLQKRQASHDSTATSEHDPETGMDSMLGSPKPASHAGHQSCSPTDAGSKPDSTAHQQ